MKVDFLQELKDFSGEELKLNKDDKDNLTLKAVISIAVKSAIQEDQQLALDIKLKLDKIGEIACGGTGEFTTEMATLIKERISKVFTSPAVSGAVHRAIESGVEK